MLDIIMPRLSICDTQKDLMAEFLLDKLEGMRLRHFLNHVAKCDKCLAFILKEQGITIEENNE